MNNNLPITTELVQQLIHDQFPQWQHLDIQPVAHSGIDNRTFHLGDTLLVRLPSAQQYALQVEKEQTWLPKLAPYISLAIPEPVALGKPTHEYPYAWSVYRWISGSSINTVEAHKLDLNQIAQASAQFLHELHAISTSGGPTPGSHNYLRGTHPSVYDAEVQDALKKLHGIIDTQAAANTWKQACASEWNKKPVWIHGDLSSGNMLVHNSKLTAIIDFGLMAIGDPACDLVIAWTLFDKESRDLFQSLLTLDHATWDRARGWALWKACITLVEIKDKSNLQTLDQITIINTLLDDLVGTI